MDTDRVERFRRRLREPGPLFVAMMAIPDPVVASALVSSGIDCVFLDAEHGRFTTSSMRACLDVVTATTSWGVVRTASARAAHIQEAVACGADGVLAPHIETAEEAASVVSEVTDRQRTTRAVALVIIESRLGVANASEIAHVPGVDGIMVGPADLAADLGVDGQLDHPAVREATEEVVRSALAAGLKVSPWRTPRTDAERDSMLVYCFGDRAALSEAAATAVALARERTAGIYVIR